MKKPLAMPPARLHPANTVYEDGGDKKDPPPIVLSAGLPLAGALLVLTSGTCDEIESGGLEIHPFGLDSVEFDEAGTMEVSIT